jgi:hypothetical protein
MTAYDPVDEHNRQARQAMQQELLIKLMAHATERVTFSGYSPEMSLR